jgi:hypothetical protein
LSLIHLTDRSTCNEAPLDTYNILKRTLTVCEYCALVPLTRTVGRVILYEYEEQGSSGSVVSDYGLNDWAIGVRSPAEAKEEFSSNLCVQTGSEAHPASGTMGTGGPFPGAKERLGRDADSSHPFRG